MFGLCAAFAYATYLSYYGAADLLDAFSYQNDVVAAQEAISELEVQKFDAGASPRELEPYVELLETNLKRIDLVAKFPDERAPAFHAESREDYESYTGALLRLQSAGNDAFQDIVQRNRATRDLSNAMFALIALLFAVLVGRLRRTIAEGVSLVERLQRAFISTRRSIPNVDLGSVLISATRGSNVGGDTFDAFTLDGTHGLFLIADVSGKGIDAAVDTALIKYTMRTLFSEHPDPGSMLEKFAKIYGRTAENPETFVVLFVAVIDLEDGTVRYASAGHEPAWVVRRGVVETLAPTGSIVGIDFEERYDTRTFRLAPGDALVVSTDGLTESRDARGTMLGAEAVASWLAELLGPAQVTADAIVRRLRKRSSRITDDLAILVVRYAPTPHVALAVDVRPALASDPSARA